VGSQHVATCDPELVTMHLDVATATRPSCKGKALICVLANLVRAVRFSVCICVDINGWANHLVLEPFHGVSAPTGPAFFCCASTSTAWQPFRETRHHIYVQDIQREAAPDVYFTACSHCSRVISIIPKVNLMVQLPRPAEQTTSLQCTAMMMRF
jgi:hypothetical protein